MILDSGHPNPKTAAGRRKTYAILAAVVIFALICGCGKKGPPVPPKVEAAPVVKDLKAEVTGDRLRLSWDSPAPEAVGVRLEEYTVYRAKIRPGQGDCEGCPLMFVRVGSVAPDGTPIFEEMLESGYRYVYKVAARTRVGWQSESNPVTLNH